ncbi:MAG: helix-turn-helix transcriptional regulator [Rhodospirillales bacterium]|nr:helix-turn-helix transcriptional regulator [Rhodospirillales bacterium]MBN8903290.1 helix-turn-helix transcriptional regulator [Rhodospirillales bacterium]
MEDAAPHTVERRLADRLRSLRAERSLSLDELARQSGVSRSMISLIERAESSPTANILDKLSAALGVTLAALFADAARPDAAPLARAADQATWRDPATGYHRRNLSPAGFRSPIELVEVHLPPGARVAYDTGPRSAVIDQQVWLIAGELHLTVGTTTHALAAGDCLAMRLDVPVVFHNPSTTDAHYLVALTNRPAGAAP